MVGTKLATADDSIEQRGMPIVQLMNVYCMDCHNASDAKAGLNLELAVGKIKQSGSLSETDTLEKVVKRLRAREMPPADATRPDEKSSKTPLTALESILDLAAAKNPQPGRTDSIRRLNRTEYHNAIRDLLAMDVDVNSILPADESGHGFDNFTVGDLPPMLLSRYITAAQQISRFAVGSSIRSPEGINVRLPADRTQDSHVEGIGLSNLRRRIGLEVVLFSMEQHTGRGVAFVGGELTASQA